MTESKRPYRKRARARAQDETRQRIVEAAMHLHEEIGPAATTISAIAGRAGVQRLTVYRHFPDDTALFRACTAHWLALNPPPDPQSWPQASGGVERVRQAVGAFHAYYRRTQRMWTVSFRDVETVPALQGPMAEFAGFVRGVADDLAAQVATPGTAWAVAATLRHALHFLTWQELEEQGLPDPAKLDLVTAWLRGAQAPGTADAGQDGPALEAAREM